MPKIETRLYILESNGAYKIGVSSNIEDRASTIQTSSPFPVKIVKVFESNLPYELEKHLHRKFAEKNIHGEWFALSAEDLPKIESIISGFPNQPLLFTHEPHVEESRDEGDAQLLARDLERFYICPVCNFLTKLPGTCYRCLSSGLYKVVSKEIAFVHQWPSIDYDCKTDDIY